MQITDGMTPEQIAAEIVAAHLSDLPRERQVVIQDAIESSLNEWGYIMQGHADLIV